MGGGGHCVRLTEEGWCLPNFKFKLFNFVLNTESNCVEILIFQHNLFASPLLCYATQLLEGAFSNIVCTPSSHRALAEG